MYGRWRLANLCTMSSNRTRPQPETNEPVKDEHRLDQSGEEKQRRPTDSAAQPARGIVNENFAGATTGYRTSAFGSRHKGLQVDVFAGDKLHLVSEIVDAVKPSRRILARAPTARRVRHTVAAVRAHTHQEIERPGALR